jgi:hypothetical protein
MSTIRLNSAHTPKNILQCLPENVGTNLFSDYTLHFPDLRGLRTVALNLILKKTGEYSHA